MPVFSMDFSMVCRVSGVRSLLSKPASCGWASKTPTRVASIPHWSIPGSRSRIVVSGASMYVCALKTVLPVFMTHPRCV